MNKAFLAGNLTKDPELKYTQSGKAYARCGIAVKRPFSKDITDFFNILAWEKSAEFLAKYFTKGSRILIEGRIQTGSYDDKDGNKRYTFDIVVDQIEFAGSQKPNDKPADKPADKPKTVDIGGFPGEPIDPDDTPF